LPCTWLLSQRIRHAQHLLETTDEPIERISALGGFGSPANLRQHFTRATDVSPLTYRRTFRSPGGAERSVVPLSAGMVRTTRRVLAEGL
jgi:transcriptional regulator GlxA family with amidase domain